MAGASIDHMISLTILIAALLIAMTSFNQLFSTAITYDANTQVATKAIDIMNTLCLSPGNPVDWGATNSSVLGFGLQDPQGGGYVLSPYSMMRLKTSNVSQLIEYSKTPGIVYNNLSANYGNGIFTAVGDCVTYDQASELLGLNGTYGFQLDVTPTLNIIISPLSGKHLILEIEIKGSGLPLSGATINYNLFHVDGISIVPYSGVNQTDSFGKSVIEFEAIDDDEAFSFTVHARLGGLAGAGYYAQNSVDDELQYVIPLIQDYDNGTVIIAHAWDIFEDSGISAAVQVNSTFFILTEDFQFQEVDLDFDVELLNFGEGKPYFTAQLPPSEVGLLVISYKKATNKVGSVILPWGLSTLGLSASFRSDSMDSGNSNFVATELRQVNINGISYQVKVSTWKLEN